FEPSELSAARHTPRRPEREQHRFAAIVIQADARTIQPCENWIQQLIQIEESNPRPNRGIILSAAKLAFTNHLSEREVCGRIIVLVLHFFDKPLHVSVAPCQSEASCNLKCSSIQESGHAIERVGPSYWRFFDCQRSDTRDKILHLAGP